MKQLDEKFARPVGRAQARMTLVEVPGPVDRMRPLRAQAQSPALPAPPVAANPARQRQMKLLVTSTDFDDLGRIVKRLVWARIPCAVCKDPGSSHLSVWIQRDTDFPLALRVVVNREERPRLPHWARALEPAPAVTERLALPATNRLAPPRELLVESRTSTWTGTGCVTNLGCAAEPTRPVKPVSWPLFSAYAASDSPADEVDLECPAKHQWDQGVPIE